MIIMVVSSPLLAGLDDAGIRPAELEDLALTGPPATGHHEGEGMETVVTNLLRGAGEHMHRDEQGIRSFPGGRATASSRQTSHQDRQVGVHRYDRSPLGDVGTAKT